MPRDKLVDYHIFRYAYYLEQKSQNLRDDYQECMRSFIALKKLGVLKQRIDKKSNFWFVMVEPFKVDGNKKLVLSEKFAEYKVNSKAIHELEISKQTI